MTLGKLSSLPKLWFMELFYRNPHKWNPLITRSVVFSIYKFFWLIFLKPSFPCIYPQHQIENHHRWTAAPKPAKQYDRVTDPNPAGVPLGGAHRDWEQGEPLLPLLLGWWEQSALGSKVRSDCSCASTFLACSQCDARGYSKQIFSIHLAHVTPWETFSTYPLSFPSATYASWGFREHACVRIPLRSL